MIKQLIKFLGGVFRDERGSPSSKRIAGMLCVVTLCFIAALNTLQPKEIKPSSVIIDSITLLAFGCLGLSSIDKIWGKRDIEKNAPQPSE